MINKEIALNNIYIRFQFWHKWDATNSDSVKYGFGKPELGILFKKSRVLAKKGKPISTTSKLVTAGHYELKIALIICTIYLTLTKNPL